MSEALKNMKRSSGSGIWPIFALIFVPVTLVAGIFLFLVFYEQYVSQKDQLRASERFSLSSQVEKITDDFGIVVDDLRILSMHEELAELLVSGGEDHKRQLAKEFVVFSEVRGIYDQIRYIDEKGMEAVRVNYRDGKPYAVAEAELQDKSDRYYFSATVEMKEGEVYVSPFDLNMENGKVEEPYKPVLRFATAIFDDKGRNRGVVVVNYLASKMFDNLKRSVSSSHGHRFFLNAQGYYLYGPDSTRLWGFLFEDMKEETFGRDYPDAWRQISAAESGQFITEEGLITFNTVRPDLKVSGGASASSEGELYWKVVSIAPAALFEEILGRIFTIYILIMIIITAPIAAFSWLLARGVVSRREAMVKQRNLIGELQEALGSIKTLSGLLPICGYCKNIRDDKGYWRKVESYIGDRSDAEFSHGICDDCAEKMKQKNEEIFKKK